ncbi:hypothetical protein KBC80_00620 [Candidatus Woesebacteria bacterium]|nr:hypothetical protein [Candidatus Woesebacteria bacterium]
MKERLSVHEKSATHEVNMPHSDKVLRPLNAMDRMPIEPDMKKSRFIIMFVYTLLLLLGVSTGYLLVSKTSLGNAATAGTSINTPKVVGVKDAIFKDCATGVIEKEGMDGEGTHKLIREGGPSQTAYLLSSVVDMDQYVNLKVKVCGQTVAAKNVSWLMDIGRLELLEK